MRLQRREHAGLEQLVAPDSKALGAVPERLAVELPGALLEWPLTATAGTLPIVTLRDTGEVDWFWQLFGADAHLAMLEGAAEIPVTPDAETLHMLQRLGHALWARAWWPASEREAIPALEKLLLDAEIIVLCAALDDLAGGALDGEVDLALAVHSPGDFAGLQHFEHPAVRELGARVVEWCGWEAVVAATLARRADYALAAAGTPAEAVDALANGSAELAWQAVPAGIFDAAERPIHWTVDAQPEPLLRLRCDLLIGGNPAGIPVSARLDGDAEPLTGTLNERGLAELPLPLDAAEVWSRDWSSLRIHVGAAGEVTEDAAMRDHIRAHARARLDTEDALTLAAERLAAESDF